MEGKRDREERERERGRERDRERENKREHYPLCVFHGSLLPFKPTPQSDEQSILVTR